MITTSGAGVMLTDLVRKLFKKKYLFVEIIEKMPKIEEESVAARLNQYFDRIRSLDGEIISVTPMSLSREKATYCEQDDSVGSITVQTYDLFIQYKSDKSIPYIPEKSKSKKEEAPEQEFSPKSLEKKIDDLVSSAMKDYISRYKIGSWDNTYLLDIDSQRYEIDYQELSDIISQTKEIILKDVDNFEQSASNNHLREAYNHVMNVHLRLARGKSYDITAFCSELKEDFKTAEDKLEEGYLDSTKTTVDTVITANNLDKISRHLKIYFTFFIHLRAYMQKIDEIIKPKKN